jgi:hypothetical protein
MQGTQEIGACNLKPHDDEQSCESDSGSSSSWDLEEEKIVHKPESLDPSCMVTTEPGESPLCWVCRLVIEKYDGARNNECVLAVSENLTERAEDVTFAWCFSTLCPSRADTS